MFGVRLLSAASRITRAVVGGILVHGGEDDEEESLGLFENNIYVDILYTFIGYRPLSESKHLENCSP